MLDGFWTVVFSAQQDIGAGVVKIENGRALGGDTSFTYVGPFNVAANGSINAELRIQRHSAFLPSVLPGLDDYTLLVSGTASGNSFALTGKIKGQESQAMTIKGRRVD